MQHKHWLAAGLGARIGRRLAQDRTGRLIERLRTARVPENQIKAELTAMATAFAAGVAEARATLDAENPSHDDH